MSDAVTLRGAGERGINVIFAREQGNSMNQDVNYIASMSFKVIWKIRYLPVCVNTEQVDCQRSCNLAEKAQILPAYSDHRFKTECTKVRCRKVRAGWLENFSIR